MLGPLLLVMRFETDAQGRTLAFLDMPQQNIRNSPITDVELAGTKLTFAIPGFGESTRVSLRSLDLVIPGAGRHPGAGGGWIPAFAGMTEQRVVIDA